MMEFVSWYYDIPNIWKVIKFHGSSHHQPVYTFCGDGRINCINQLWSSQNNPKLRLVTQLPVLKLWRAFSSQCFTVRNSVRYKLQNNNVLLVKIDGPGAGIPSIIIYPLLKGFLQTPLLINQPMGKGHLCSKIPSMSRRVWIQPSDQSLCIAGSSWTLFMADHSWKKNIIISATSGSNKWDRSDRYSTVILCKAEKKTTSWASPSVAKKRTLKLPVPSLTVNLSMETYGSMWKLCGSWVLECAQCPQNCMPKNTFSDHGRWLRHFLCVPWVNWRGWIIKMGVLGYEGSIVSSISLCPFVHGQNAYFSHLHSPLCALNTVRVATNICESCQWHSAQQLCHVLLLCVDSLVRGQVCFASRVSPDLSPLK